MTNIFEQMAELGKPQEIGYSINDDDTYNSIQETMGPNTLITVAVTVRVAPDELRHIQEQWQAYLLTYADKISPDSLIDTGVKE